MTGQGVPTDYIIKLVKPPAAVANDVSIIATQETMLRAQCVHDSCSLPHA